MRLLQSVVIQQEVLEDLCPSIVALLKNREIRLKRSELFLAPEARGLGIGLGDSAWEK